MGDVVLATVNIIYADKLKKKQMQTDLFVNWTFSGLKIKYTQTVTRLRTMQP